MIMYLDYAFRMADSPFVKFYRSILNQSNLGKSAMIADRKEVLRCQSLIWDVIAKSYLRNDGGVYINNLGYLCHVIRPKARINPNNPYYRKGVNREALEGYRYIHVCYDFNLKNTYFRIEPSERIKLACRIYMNKGKRYKFLYREVESERETFGKGRIIKLKKIKRARRDD